MGAPASPLTWNILYDPIVASLSTAMDAPCPTYADDLAMATIGPAQCNRGLLFLLTASSAAGLAIDSHICAWVEGRHFSPDHEAAMERLPVKSRLLHDDDGTPVWKVTGLPPEFICVILEAADPDAPPDLTVCRTVCTCSVKTAVVARGDQAAWTRGLATSPLGSTVLRRSSPYLGVGVIAPAHQAGLTDWSRKALSEGTMATWLRPLRTVSQRVDTLCARHLSSGYRAGCWNTFVASVPLYFAMVSPPGPPRLRPSSLLPYRRWALKGGPLGWRAPPSTTHFKLRAPPAALSLPPRLRHSGGAS